MAGHGVNVEVYNLLRCQCLFGTDVFRPWLLCCSSQPEGQYLCLTVVKGHWGFRGCKVCREVATTVGSVAETAELWSEG